MIREGGFPAIDHKGENQPHKDRAEGRQQHGQQRPSGQEAERGRDESPYADEKDEILGSSLHSCPLQDRVRSDVGSALENSADRPSSRRSSPCEGAAAMSHVQAATFE
ncbi:hypothetical protein [Georgenia sp. SUBG003]|uniref:hypothetical protein n=1 Tax=Georgenia sp. SUBG003 TaxID=1497974 RepID=UPI003AB57988